MTNLELAQDNIRAVESKDLAAVAASLADDVEQVFLHTTKTKTLEGVAAVKADGAREGLCVAVFRGRQEVLDYTQGLMNNFSRLVWVGGVWSTSADGKTVVFAGKGDMVAARSGRPYRNNYVTKFEFADGKIVRMYEYADAFLYAGLWILPNSSQVRALGRALLAFGSPSARTR